MPQDYTSYRPKPKSVDLFPSQDGNNFLAQVGRRMNPAVGNRLPKKILDPSTYFHKGEYDTQYRRASGPDPVAEFREAEAANNAKRQNEYDAQQAKLLRDKMTHQRRTYSAMEKRGVYPFEKEMQYGATALGGSNGSYANQGPISKMLGVRKERPK